MLQIPYQLLTVQEDIKAGKRRWLKVKTLLSWFGQKGRGKSVVQAIEAALAETQLSTSPKFTSGGVHDYIEFKGLTGTGGSSQDRPTNSRESGDETNSDEESQQTFRTNGHGPDRRSSEAIGSQFRVGMFEAAKRSGEVLTITRDQTVEEATTMMMTHGYSQLPVTQNMRRIDGMISWRSMGRARARGAACKFVRDCLEDVHVIDQDALFFEAVDAITEKEVLLVLGEDKRVTGIVTTADLSREYHQKAEPFLLLGEVEDRIRILISKSFSVDEIKQASNPTDRTRGIENASDLTFGEYVRLLESPENWQKLGLKIDRSLLVELLNEVREVRNDVMHFRLDTDEPEGLDRVRQLHSLLGQLVE